jgi:hypothetical protein
MPAGPCVAPSSARTRRPGSRHGLPPGEPRREDDRRASGCRARDAGAVAAPDACSAGAHGHERRPGEEEGQDARLGSIQKQSCRVALPSGRAIRIYPSPRRRGVTNGVPEVTRQRHDTSAGTARSGLARTTRNSRTSRPVASCATSVAARTRRAPASASHRLEVDRSRPLEDEGGLPPGEVQLSRISSELGDRELNRMRQHRGRAGRRKRHAMSDRRRTGALHWHHYAQTSVTSDTQRGSQHGMTKMSSSRARRSGVASKAKSTKAGAAKPRRKKSVARKAPARAAAKAKARPGTPKSHAWPGLPPGYFDRGR